MDLANLRREYALHGLNEAEVDRNPFDQFRRWFAEAQAAAILEPNAMTLATVDVEAKPAARIVLLKGVDERGFLFFSNYDSRKGQEMAANPRVALLFYWAEIERQIRIEGSVERTSLEISEAYFRSRPYLSQLSAVLSEQSQVVANQAVLEERMAVLQAKYQPGEVPLPPDWGGYRVLPQVFEFWQGRPSRLHDRLQYSLLPEGVWLLQRLSP